MKPKKIAKMLTDEGAKRILYAGAYLTFRLWTDNESLSKPVRKGIRIIDAGFQKVAGIAKVDNIPNPIVSPYCVTIAQF